MVLSTRREARLPTPAGWLRRDRRRRRKGAQRIGHTLSPLEIVVVNTSAGAKFGQADYVNSGCGMGYEATMYLLERDVRLTGTDGWSWDAPFVYTAKKYAETRGCRSDLGRSQGGTAHRLLPSR
ncbi:kynurenine formamidase [Bradyrhizobium niftali]|jgi:kynurenine formamidase